jgi:phosphohistidine swiveling domain-containing protein
MSEEFITLVKRRESAWWVSTLCGGIGSAAFQSALGWEYGISDYRYVGEVHQLSVADAVTLQTLVSASGSMSFYEAYLESCKAACIRLERVAEEASKACNEGQMDAVNSAMIAFMDASTEAIPFLPTLVVIQDKLEADLRGSLAAELGDRKDSDRVTEALSLCVVAEEPTNVQLEARSVQRLAREAVPHLMLQEEGFLTATSLLEMHDDLRSGVESHVSEYGWLGTFTYLHEPYSTQEIAERVLTAARAIIDGRSQPVSSAEKRMDEAVQAAERFIDGLTDEDTKALLRLARQYLFWRFERVDVHFKAEVMMRGVESRLCDDWGIARQELAWASADEIRDAVSGAGSLPVSEMKRRRENGFDYFVEGGRHHLETAAERRKASRRAKGRIKPGGSISGSTACPGSAKGTVKVVMSISDIGKVELGDVLITTMTTPDLMLAIERSAAIVTDEGGVLCHAAIISRELDKPCVIGTGSATETFGDGDVVEVNASSGNGTITLVSESSATE